MASPSDILSLGGTPPESSSEGFHNDHFEESRERIIRGQSYRDCRTVCIIPTREDDLVHPKVADALAHLMRPMNHAFTMIRAKGFEVADAYNNGISSILANPEVSNWPFLLTIESDNTPPPDGLLKLIESMYYGPWAAVSGLYWCKGEGGAPMIFGNVNDPEVNYRPQVPVVENIQECRGIAMGFALWDMSLFRDPRLGPPWFRTPQFFVPFRGGEGGTQDLDFCKRAAGCGYRFAVDTRVRVGHVQGQASPTHPAGFVW
jgi:hypothetical protein